MTTTSDSLYLLMAASSWRSVPLKSLARSVVMRPGLGISLTLLLQIQFLLAQLAARNFLIRGAAFHQLGMGALPTMRPSSSTRIWFACSTVEMRCATMMTVALSVLAFSARRSATSVL